MAIDYLNKEPTSAKVKTVNNVLPYVILFSSLSLLIFLLYRGAFDAPLLLSWIIGGSLLYIILNKKGFFHRVNDAPGYRISKLALATFFFALLSLTLLSLLDKLYIKPIYYFIFVSAMGVSIGLQILTQEGTKKNGVYLILSQILILSLFLRLSSYLIAPPFIGSGDIWYSYYNVELPLLHAAHIPPGLAYSDFPVFNLLNAMFMEITLVHPISHIIPVSLLAAFSCIYIFLLGRKMEGTNVGLMAALLFTFIPYSIKWGSEPHPMSLSLILLLLAIYLYITKPESMGFKFMFLITLLSDIMCHTVGSLILLLFILADLAGQASQTYFKNEGWQRVVYSTALLAPVLLIGYWMYVSKTFFIDVVEFVAGRYAFPYSLGMVQPVGTPSSVPSLFINHLGIYIIFFFSIIGGLLLFKANWHHHYTVVYLCSALFLVIFILPSIGVALIPYRLEVFLQVIITIPCALGLVTLFNKIKAHRRKVLSFALILLVLCFFLITSSTTGDESAPFQTTNLNQVTYSELNMEQFAGEVISPTEDAVFCDSVTGRILFSIATASECGKQYNYSEENVEDNGYFLVSLRSLQRGTSLPVKKVKGAYIRIVLGLPCLEELSEHHNKIYDNGGAQIYHSD